VHYDWQELAAGVYRTRLPFLDVTVGAVVGDSGVLLIDCGTTLAEAVAIGEDVRELVGRDISHLVMTHHHFDHILGSAGFAEAISYAAPPVAVALTDQLDAVCAEAVRYGADRDEVRSAALLVRAPDLVVWNAEIDLGERGVRVIHPGEGHTDHDLIVVVPTSPSVIFCGDLVEESGDPAIGPDANVAAWPSALDRILETGGEEAIYVPGHGAVVDAAFLRRQRDWLNSRW
jgi:glyoxylase-like metal-dependent hydrolase (beta-lactamase superfamily II)